MQLPCRLAVCEHWVRLGVPHALLAHLDHFAVRLVSEDPRGLVPVLVEGVEAELAVVKILH